jgi:carboxyl-terminal processing protease
VSDQLVKKKHGLVSLIGTLGIGVLLAIVAFMAGLYADDTRWGKAVSGRIQEFINTKPTTDTNAGLPENLDFGTVEEAYDELRSTYAGELDEQKLLDGLKKGLYLDEEKAKQFEDDLNNEFTGIGAEIAIKNNQLQIVAPLPRTPADKAGLRPGDFIFKIGDEETLGMYVEDAVSKIRGEAGTTVTLTLGRAGKIFEEKIVRAKIKVPNVEGKVLDGNIGYIKINTFGDKVVDELVPLVDDFDRRNVAGVVLDMRGNGGGRLDMSIKVAGLWLDNAVVLEERGSKNQTLRSEGRGRLYGKPTVVLIDKGSASASEIVAGALQDNGAATLIGETSFGKGSVQSVEELRGGGQLKVTIARWYTPKGKNIDKEGIKPDVVIKLTTKDFEADRDPQLQAAIRQLAK